MAQPDRGLRHKIQAGDPNQINADIKAGDEQALQPRGPLPGPYDEADDTEGIAGVAGGGIHGPVPALRPPRLPGPWCATAQWWECPCHGSKYNQAGEWKEGPAPRGLDRFAIEVSGGQIVVDTAKVITGPPRGTHTTGQELDGPHCVGGGGRPER